MDSVAQRLSAVGAGADSQKYFGELKRNGYAEDPDYVQKGVSAANMAAPKPLNPPLTADQVTWLAGRIRERESPAKPPRQPKRRR